MSPSAAWVRGNAFNDYRRCGRVKVARRARRVLRVYPNIPLRVCSSRRGPAGHSGKSTKLPCREKTTGSCRLPRRARNAERRCGRVKGLGPDSAREFCAVCIRSDPAIRGAPPAGARRATLASQHKALGQVANWDGGFEGSESAGGVRIDDDPQILSAASRYVDRDLPVLVRDQQGVPVHRGTWILAHRLPLQFLSRAAASPVSRE